MNDTIAIIGSIVVAFLLGMFPFFYWFRGFAIPYLKSKKDKVLLRVWLKKGGFVFKVGKYDLGGIIYKLNNQEYFVNQVPEAFNRGIRTTWLDVIEGETGPLIFQRLYIDYENVSVEEMVPVIGDDGNVMIDKDTGKELFDKKIVNKNVPVRRFFGGYDDSAHINTALQLASLKAKIPIGGAFGINGKVIIIILIIIAAVAFFMLKGQGG